MKVQFQRRSSPSSQLRQMNINIQPQLMLIKSPRSDLDLQQSLNIEQSRKASSSADYLRNSQKRSVNCPSVNLESHNSLEKLFAKAECKRVQTIKEIKFPLDRLYTLSPSKTLKPALKIRPTKPRALKERMTLEQLQLIMIESLQRQHKDLNFKRTKIVKLDTTEMLSSAANRVITENETMQVSVEQQPATISTLLEQDCEVQARSKQLARSQLKTQQIVMSTCQSTECQSPTGYKSQYLPQRKPIHHHQHRNRHQVARTITQSIDLSELLRSEQITRSSHNQTNLAKTFSKCERGGDTRWQA